MIHLHSVLGQYWQVALVHWGYGEGLKIRTKIVDFKRCANHMRALRTLILLTHSESPFFGASIF